MAAGAWRLIAAVLLPWLAVGVSAAGTFAYADGPGGRARIVMIGAAVVLALAAFGASWLVLPDRFLTYAALVVLGLAVVGTLFAVQGWVLQARGEVKACTVVRVQSREETYPALDQDGDATTKTAYFHDHELRCPGGYPKNITDGQPRAEPGSRTDVIYDPSRRIAPEFAHARPDSAVLTWLAGALLALSIGLAITAVRRGEESSPSD